MPFNCEFFLIQKNEAGYDIKEIYHRKNNSSLTMPKFGFYDKDRGLQVNERGIYQRRNNLGGEIMLLDVDSRVWKAQHMFKH